MPADPTRPARRRPRVLTLTAEVEAHEKNLEWATTTNRPRRPPSSGRTSRKKAEIAKLTKYLRTGVLADLPAGFVATPAPGKVEHPNRSGNGLG
jgi:hypothetical protein